MAHRSTGLYEEIVDVLVSTKDHRRRFINVDLAAPYDNDSTSTAYGHEVFQVALKDNEKCALDIADAQYGQFTFLFPWDVYAESHVKDCIRRLDFGSTR